MENLVHFVKDLLELEEEKRRAKDPNTRKKGDCQAIKQQSEIECK